MERYENLAPSPIHYRLLPSFPIPIEPQCLSLQAMLKNISKSSNSDVKNTEKEMSFLDHLEELRWTLARSLIAIVLVAIVMYTMEDLVFKYVIFGPRSDWFITYQWFCGISDRTCFGPPEFELFAVGMGEQFYTSLKVSFFLGFIVAFPYVFYQFWKFIKPGLYEKEQKAARGVVFVCSFLFLLGTAFGYFILSPFAIRFLAGYSVSQEVVTNGASLSSYVSYMTMFTLPTGIIFELPVLIYFLAKVGLVTAAFLRTYRRHAFVIILILAAVITPPDVITQFMIGVPVFLLYEVSILIAARIEKKREKELQANT